MRKCLFVISDICALCGSAFRLHFKGSGTLLNCIVRPLLKWFRAILQVCKRLLFLEYCAQRISSCVYFLPRFSVRLTAWRKFRLQPLKLNTLTSGRHDYSSLHFVVKSVRHKQSGRSPQASIVNHHHWKALRGVDGNVYFHKTCGIIFRPSHEILQFVTVDQ